MRTTFKSTCNFLVVVKTRLFTKGKMQVFTDFSLDPIEEDISIAVGRQDITFLGPILNSLKRFSLILLVLSKLSSSNLNLDFTNFWQDLSLCLS